MDAAGRKWLTLERLATTPGGLTTRDVSDIHGWEGGEETWENGSQWHYVMSQAARTFGFLECDGYAVRAGYAVSAYPAGRPVLWVATPAGRQRAADRPPPPKQPPYQRRPLTEILAERATKTAECAEYITMVTTGLGRPVTPAERRRLVRYLAAGGATYQQIATSFGVSRELVRLDLLPEAQRKTRDRRALRAGQAREEAARDRRTDPYVTCDHPGCPMGGWLADLGLPPDASKARIWGALRKRGWVVRSPGAPKPVRFYCPDHTSDAGSKR